MKVNTTVLPPRVCSLSMHVIADRTVLEGSRRNYAGHEPGFVRVVFVEDVTDLLRHRVMRIMLGGE